MKKLSKAQLDLLRSLPANVVEYYQPAKKLIEFGLAQWSAKWEGRLERTAAGDAALAPQAEAGEG